MRDQDASCHGHEMIRVQAYASLYGTLTLNPALNPYKPYQPQTPNPYKPYKPSRRRKLHTLYRFMPNERTRMSAADVALLVVLLKKVKRMLSDCFVFRW